MATTDPAEREFTNHELRAMDDETARSTLTVEQYERRENLIDLHEQADETREEWADQAETVADVTVNADPADLGTALELYGNDIIVRVDETADGLEESMQTLEAEFGDIAEADPTDAEVMIDGVGEDDIDRLADIVADLYDAVLVRWNGTDWERLSPEQRRGVLADAREAWGFDALVLGWGEVMAAIRETREQQAEAVESFRGETRRRNH